MTENKKDRLLDEAFDDCLEMIKHQGATLTECLAKYPDMKNELEPALKTALSLQSGPLVSPDQAFRARVKGTLVAGQAPVAKQQRGFAVRPFIYRVAAVTIALALILGSVGYASTDSMPDDPLYPVKQLIEKIRLAVTTDNQAEVELHLQLAEERLAEADAMAEEGKTDEARQALNDLNKEMREAYRLAGMVPGHDRDILLAKFAVISQRHMLVLEGVLERAPESAKPAIERAMAESAKGLKKADEAVLKLERDRVREEEQNRDRDREQERESEQNGKPEDTPGIGGDNGQVQTETTTQTQGNSSNGQGQGTGNKQ